MEHDEVSEEYLLNIRREKTARELDRIRNSFSFRCGQIIAKCLRFPPLLIVLPFWLFGFCFIYGLERLGRRPAHQVHSGRSIQNPKRCMVFFPTNGVGLGHFTRLFAVAKRVREQDPDVEIVFVTTMAALHLLESEGIPSYHLPGSYMFNDMTSAEWNAITEELLATVFEIHRPSVFVFDGAFPYRGMLNAIRSRDRIEKVWVRRGMFRKGSNIPVDSIEHFTSIVRPGDSVDVDEHLKVEISVQSHSVSPMLLMNHDEVLTKEQASGRLNLPDGSKIVYVQLGAGRINDIDSEIRLTVDALLNHENVHVVIGESMLGDRIYFQHPRVQLLRDYPNSMYFRAFDASIQAGGYNSFHEMRTFGLPTLFYPNMNTGMDDQLARCNIAQKEGWGLVLEERTEASIARSVEMLLELKVPDERPQPTNGADELATLLLEKIR